jgi:V8-like Glu-specific endopeptidase
MKIWICLFISVLSANLFSSFASADRGVDTCADSEHQNFQTDFMSMAAVANGVSSEIPASGSAYIKEAAIYGADNRRVPNGANFPWRAYGKLKVADAFSSFCTVSLVSACHAIGIGHCVAKQDKNGDMIPKFDTNHKPEFLSANGKTTANVEIAAAFQGDYDKDLETDISFIKLDKPIGRELGWLGVADKTGDDLTGPKFFGYGFGKDGYTIAGFNADVQKGDVLSVDDNATMLLRKGNLVQFRVNSFSGSSGGPIVSFNSKGEPEIVGLNTRAFLGTIPNSNIHTQIHLPADETESAKLATGIASHAFAKDLLKFIHDNPCPPAATAQK